MGCMRDSTRVTERCRDVTCRLFLAYSRNPMTSDRQGLDGSLHLNLCLGTLE